MYNYPIFLNILTTFAYIPVRHKRSGLPRPTVLALEPRTPSMPSMPSSGVTDALLTIGE